MSTAAVEQLNAALSGRYRVEREIGEGGMATVYLADDLKHERRVALKVLKPELSAVVGADRFLAEIKTTANLQHPHILPLFDSGEADGFLYFVMPYIEGETLRDRIDREKQLPVDEALGIATAVANALQTAHDQGVVHRDIKPANILLSQGEPLVADFGIALAVGAAGGGRLTETGLSVGTPYYMSPEQATGDQSIGPHSDTYALAAVLYEMLIGDPPYVGSTAQAVLGKIIQGAPVSATQIRQSVPTNVDAAIRKALERLPADRFTGARDFAKALADTGFRHGSVEEAAIAAPASPWNRLAATLAALLVLATGVAGWALLQPEDPEPIERFALDLASLVPGDISPDGSAIVFRAVGSDGGQNLFVRRMDNLVPVQIPGTGGGGPAIDPAISPDGQEVAFVWSGEVRVAPVAGGVVRTVADSANCCTTWGKDGFIYYGGGSDVAIKRVPASGGTIEVVTTPGDDQDGQHGFFQPLPGGEFGVFTVWVDAQNTRIEAVRMSTGERRVLAPGLKPYVTATGHLLFLTLDGELMAAPIDEKTMELTGAPVPLVDGIGIDANATPIYSLSDAGTLLYMTGSGGGASEFVWVTRSGAATAVDPGHTFILNTNFGITLSPDESAVAFNSVVDGNDDVRIKHLPDGPEERLTFAEEIDYRPLWTPDGLSVTYFSGASADDRNVWSKRADGTGDAMLLLDDERSLNWGSWSPDGEVLVVRAAATAAMGLGRRDVLAYRPGVDSAAVPLLDAPDFAEQAPALSPDGRWLAYTSDENGVDEIFVRAFPNVDSTRVRVSGAGGITPVWAKDGTELFFVDGLRGLVAVAFDPSTGEFGNQTTLFTVPAAYQVNGSNHFYDVTADGRFLFVRPFVDENEGEVASGWILVQNFFEELKTRVPN